MLEPAVCQPIGDLGAVQQPLAPAEVPVFTEHPAVGTGWGGTGQDGQSAVTPGGQMAPSSQGRGERGQGSLTSRL